MKTKKTKLTVEVEYDPKRTDPKGLARAMDRLMETALSIPDVMDEYGSPKIGEFFVVPAAAGWVLYDFDMRDLASTEVYTDMRKAVDDAAQLDNVIVVPLFVGGRRGEKPEEEDDAEDAADHDSPSNPRIRIDRQLLSRQRVLLAEIIDHARRHVPYVPKSGDDTLLDGLLDLADEIDAPDALPSI